MNAPRFVMATIIAAIAGIAVIAAAALIARTPESEIPDDLVSPIERPQTDGEVQFVLEPGASARDIGTALEDLGVIRTGNQFSMLVNLMGVEDRLQADTYLFESGSSSASIIARMIVRDVAPVIRMTFPEGIRIEEMAEIVELAGFATANEFLEAVDNAVVPPTLAALIPAGQGLQGFLFPDTYILPQTATPDDLVELMLTTMNLRFDGELRQAALDAGFISAYEAIVMASIIEREAALESERALISGVFHNRLAAGDVLGADPTVQYVAALNPANVAAWGYWKPGNELTLEELADPSPYNTRVSPGLPPSPITNPGLAAIEAAVRPAETDFYFFVADAIAADGSHRFAVTEEEHFANIAQYGGQ